MKKLDESVIVKRFDVTVLLYCTGVLYSINITKYVKKKPEMWLLHKQTQKWHDQYMCLISKSLDRTEYSVWMDQFLMRINHVWID